MNIRVETSKPVVEKVIIELSPEEAKDLAEGKPFVGLANTLQYSQATGGWVAFQSSVVLDFQTKLRNALL